MLNNFTSESRTCLIIAFMRPENVALIIDSCVRNGVKRIYLSIDGPRNDVEQREQRRFDEIINSMRNMKIKVVLWRRKENLGVAISVIKSIDWFFTFESEGMILEDDLILSDSFFNFTFNALNLYRERRNVFMISGDNLFEFSDSSNRALGCNYPLIWGWATWKDRWDQFRPSYFSFIKIKSSVPFGIGNFWKVGYLRVISRKIDTWDLALSYYLRNLKLICVFPPANLISNRGYDVHAIHTNSSDYPLNFPITEIFNTSFPLSFDESELRFFNGKLERDVFKIKFKHFFSNLIFIFFTNLQVLFLSKKYFQKLGKALHEDSKS